MKKICEICDVSQEYEMKENSILVCVSDLDQDRLFSILPELKKNFNKVMIIKKNGAQALFFFF